ncbi:hypothetical protein PG991_003525 [Apiospora marii]|uniref:Alpha/beta hydrolase fold-3 domain-containing protein n=1 Tax=Apiospora marii TaxID=335849 RepID=A0ABR1S3R4_9PEZI
MDKRPDYVGPDYWRLLGGRVPEPKPPAADVDAIRKMTIPVMQAASDTFPFPEGMDTSVSTATSSIDGHPITITRFVPLAVQQQQSKDKNPQRAIIYAFGGGLVAGTAAISRNMIAHFAEQTGTQVFAPDYRLAPEQPYPAAFHDMYATVVWLQAHAEGFGVDPARIILAGQSAGGNLAAAAALEARDRKLTPPLAGLLLRYPMLDDRTRWDPENPRGVFLSWTPSYNLVVWEAYLKGIPKEEREGRGSRVVPPTAAPGRADDLHGLPPTHLGVGELDHFHDETVRFAKLLKAHEIEVEWHVYPGVPHGFDGNPVFSVRDEMWRSETEFVRRF